MHSEQMLTGCHYLPLLIILLQILLLILSIQEWTGQLEEPELHTLIGDHNKMVGYVMVVIVVFSLLKKNVFHAAQKGTLSTASGWSTAPNAIDVPFIRYSDVLLMAAECEIETNGNLELARTYINDVRTRAGKFVQGAGTSEATISAPLTGGAGTVNGTKYKVGTYTSAFANQADARQALRWERRMELAMEGYRFFDLRRWNDLQTLVDYLAVEKTRRLQLYGATEQPTATKLKYYPLPSVEIDLSKIDGAAQLKQNAGY